MMAPSRDIILYTYSFSPYGRRLVWYLNLRGIPYSQCSQPPMLPRPDVKDIGTVYRRIPILAIGRDIYNDTRLVISKLEELFPQSPKLSTTSPDHKAIERLLEHWAVEEGLFKLAARLIPSDTPILQDPKWADDRADYSGARSTKESIAKGRPEALVEMARAFEILETTMLADDRDWILKTGQPSLADIEAIWPFHWLTTLKGALPADFISPTQFPKVFAWIERFYRAVKAAAQKAGKPKPIKGPEAVKQISSSEFAESEAEVDPEDPTGFKKGQEIEVWPIDSGFNHKDRGKLVGLSGKEIVIESKTKEGKMVRIHAPRHGFRVRAVGGSKL